MVRCLAEDVESGVFGMIEHRRIVERGYCISARSLRLDDLLEADIVQVMTAKEIRYRRREAIEMYRAQKWYEGLRAHNRRVLTGGRSKEAMKAISSLPERLDRASKPTDQAVLHRQISSVFLPRRPV